MKEINPFSKQELLVGDVVGLQRGKELELKHRVAEIFQSGIQPYDPSLTTVPFDLSVNAIDATLIDVSYGVAYDKATFEAIDESATPQTETNVGGERIEIVKTATITEAVTYDADPVTFANTLNKVDTQPVPVSTPLSTGNKAIPLADYALNTLNYVYVVAVKTVDLNNLAAYLVGGAATVKSVVEVESGALKYPYFRNGYAIFVSLTPPNADGTLPASTFAAYFTLGQTIGTEAICIGKVAALGVGVNLTPTRLITEGDFTSLGIPDVNFTRKVYKINPRAVRVQVPTTTRGAAVPDPSITPAADYYPGADVTLEKFVKGIGSGTPSGTNVLGLTPADIGSIATVDLTAHQIEEHSNGLVTTNYKTLLPDDNNPDFINLSAFYAEIDPFDATQILLHSLVTPATTSLPGVTAAATIEEAYVNGVRILGGDIIQAPPDPLFNITTSITAATATTATVYKYKFGVTPDANYYIYLNESKNLIISSSLPSGAYLLLNTFNIAPTTLLLTKVSDDRKFGGTGRKDIQDFEVMSDKLNFDVRRANKANIEYVDGKTIKLRDFSQLPSFTMDGFYSAWCGGYVREDINGRKSLTNGRLRTCWSPTPTAVLPALGAPGSDLDIGNLVANNWYVVYAIEEEEKTTFQLRFSTLLKVRATPASDELKATPHNLRTGAVLDYGWATGEYAGCQALVLTGVAKGKIVNILDNTSDTLVLATGDSTDINAFDWLMISPANSSVNAGLAIKNFRFIGIVASEGAPAIPGDIRNFIQRDNNCYTMPDIGNTAVSGINLEASLVAGRILTPPLTTYVSGQILASCTREERFAGDSFAQVHTESGSYPAYIVIGMPETVIMFNNTYVDTDMTNHIMDGYQNNITRSYSTIISSFDHVALPVPGVLPTRILNFTTLNTTSWYI